MALTFNTHLHSLTNIVELALRPYVAIVYKKTNDFLFLPYKSLSDQIWPLRKIGKSQPRVIM